MAEMDRYVRAIQDLLGQLGTPAERLNAMEQVLGRFPAAETRRAAGGFVSDLAGTPERVLELRRLLAEFASPAKQLRVFEDQIGTTRQQLLLLAQQLEGVEGTIRGFAELAEQLATLQEPFTNLSAALRGDDGRAAPDVEPADVEPEEGDDGPPA